MCRHGQVKGTKDGDENNCFHDAYKKNNGYSSVKTDKLVNEFKSKFVEYGIHLNMIFPNNLTTITSKLSIMI